jgi:hypothetical protein
MCPRLAGLGLRRCGLTGMCRRWPGTICHRVQARQSGAHSHLHHHLVLLTIREPLLRRHLRGHLRGHLHLPGHLRVHRWLMHLHHIMHWLLHHHRLRIREAGDGRRTAGEEAWWCNLAASGGSALVCLLWEPLVKGSFDGPGLGVTNPGSHVTLRALERQLRDPLRGPLIWRSKTRTVK